MMVLTIVAESFWHKFQHQYHGSIGRNNNFMNNDEREGLNRLNDLLLY